MSRRRALLLALLIGGCAHGPGARVGDGAELGVARVAAEVERIRGLRRVRPLAVQVLDPAGFKRALAERARLDRRELERERSVWIAFGFVPAGFDLGGAIRDVIGEQVVAFYDHRRRVLYLPRTIAPSAGESDWIVAHEIEHALQDQAFGLSRKIDGDDRRLAWSALVEGDAMMAMTGLIAERNKLALSVAFGRLGAVVRALPPDTLAQMGGHSPAIGRAPALLRETLLFPYVGALELLSMVHRAGAFPLIDAMFAHPPISTEQVLHPDKYVVGEPPVPVEAPRLPPAWRLIERETLGELRTRVLFDDCLSYRMAQGVAAGWGGDRYAVGVRGGRLALWWSTAWDDEAHAIAFASALESLRKCWRPAPAGATPTISDEAAIVRVGARVAFVRGLPSADAEARALLAQPLGVARAVAPLPVASLPPPPPTEVAPEGSRAQLLEGRFLSPWLGLEAELPRGVDGAAGMGQTQLTFRRVGAQAAGGAIIFVPAAPTAATLDQLYRGVVGGADAMLSGGAKLQQRDDGEVDLGWARGRQRSWQVDGGRGMRVYTLPFCDGRAFVAVTLGWSDAATREELEAWARSIGAATGVPPACAR